MKKKARFRFFGFGPFSKKRLRERSVGSDEGIGFGFGRLLLFAFFELNRLYDVFSFRSLTEEHDEVVIGRFRFRIEELELGQLFGIVPVPKGIQEFNVLQKGLEVFLLIGFREPHPGPAVRQDFRKTGQKETFRGSGRHDFVCELVFLGRSAELVQIFAGEVPDRPYHSPPFSFIIASFDKTGDYFLHDRGFRQNIGHTGRRSKGLLQTHFLHLLGTNGTARVSRKVAEIRLRRLLMGSRGGSGGDFRC